MKNRYRMASEFLDASKKDKRRLIQSLVYIRDIDLDPNCPDWSIEQWGEWFYCQSSETKKEILNYFEAGLKVTDER